MRFSLKTFFVVIALLAVYLAWRIRDPEGLAILAIHEASGETYYGYQQPWMGSTKLISMAMLPGYEYYSQHDLTCTGVQTAPELSLAEIFFGEGKERRVNAVVVPIGQVTPQLEQLLHSLKELRYLVLVMPASMTNEGSADAQRLRELKAEFGDRVWPTVHLGM